MQRPSGVFARIGLATDPRPEPPSDSRLDRELISLSFRMARASPWSPVAGLVVLLGLLADRQPPIVLVALVAIYLAFCEGQRRLSILYFASAGDDPRPWANAQAVLSLMTGGVWGAAGALLFEPGDPVAQAIVTAALVMVSSTAVMTKSAFLPTLSSFLLAALIPPAARAALVLDPYSIAVTTVLLLMYVAAMRWGQNVHASHREMLALRFSNAGLIDDLARARDHAIAAHSRLEEREAHLRHLYESVPAAIAVIDPMTGEILLANPTFGRFVSRPPSELVGTNISEIGSTPLERHRIMEAMTVGRGDTGRTGHDGREVRLSRSDGGDVWLQVSTTPIRFRGQEALYLAALDVTRRKAVEQRLRELATTDELTRLHNRRHFLELAATEFARSRRYRRPLSLMMIDLDYFKWVNDTQGHAAGDRVLAAVAEALFQATRQQDIVGRIGGEEFAVLLPETEGMAAVELAERLRLAVVRLALAPPDEALRLSISAGVSALLPEDASIEAPMRRADRALYLAKAAGRNRIAASPEAE